jgi:hypothetical protein
MSIAERRSTPTRPVLLAAAWSLLLVALGGWWWLRPDTYPFGGPHDDGRDNLLDLLPPAAVPPLLVAAGALGVAVAVLGAARGTAGLVGAVAAAYTVGFGLVAPGPAPLTLVGYAMVMFGLPVLFVVVLAGAWRWRGGPVAVGVFVVLGLVAWVTGFADAAVLQRYVTTIVDAGAKFVEPLVLMFLLLGGLAWAALGVAVYRSGRVGRPAPEWTRPAAAARWGKAATLIAAACALPYGLHRLTWLTPWPLGMESEALVAFPEMRLHGFLLGMSALAGAVLTTGLICRWGEVWPRWMPVVRGRPVPVAAAVVPGTLVAALFTVSAVPMIRMSIEQDALWGLLVFPFPVWGPALGAAVLAYALRRRGTSVPTGTLGGS